MSCLRRFWIAVIFSVWIFSLSMSLATAADKGKSGEQALGVSAQDDMGLTQEQKDKLKALRENIRAKQDGLRNDLRVAKEALQKELDSANPDRRKADNLVASINKLQTQILSLRVEQVFSMRATLTPEQYEKLIKEREKRRQEMKVKVQQSKPKPKTSPKAKTSEKTKTSDKEKAKTSSKKNTK